MLRPLFPATTIGRATLAASLSLFVVTANAAPAVGANPPAVVKTWRDIANLPDWRGTWKPDVSVEFSEFQKNPLPWNPKAQLQIDHLKKESDAGRPTLILWGCFPHGMPGFMMINHNLMEILFSPGRVTILGEVDGNRLRRIWTDGRPHPADPEPTFHGHSTGKWEADTLVVDTVGVAPQVAIATSETVGLPNDGDLHIVERIRLRSQDVLEDSLTITAPHVLTQPWSTTRLYKRLRGVANDITEGQCVRGDYSEAVDANGNAIFVPFTPPK